MPNSTEFVTGARQPASQTGRIPQASSDKATERVHEPDANGRPIPTPVPGPHTLLSISLIALLELILSRFLRVISLYSIFGEAVLLFTFVLLSVKSEIFIPHIYVLLFMYIAYKCSDLIFALISELTPRN